MSPVFRKHVSWLGLGFLGVMGLLLYLLRAWDEPAAPVTGRALEQLVADPAFKSALGRRDAGWERDLEGYLLTALAALDKQYKIRLRGVNLNGPINPAAVNLYFVKMQHLPSLSRFRGTCTYLGVKYTIFCDLDFIDQMQSPPTIGLPSPTGNDSSRQLMDAMVRASNANVLLWLLGHELGHLAHGHGTHDFTGSRILGRSDYQARFSDPKEQAADRFSVELFDGAGLDPNYGFVFGSSLDRAFHALINRLGNEILAENKLPLPLVNYTGPIPVRAGSLRDALFARAVNMQLLVIRKYNIESPDYYESIRKRIEFRD